MELTQKQKNITIIVFSILVETYTNIMFKSIECDIKAHTGNPLFSIYFLISILIFILIIVEFSKRGINWTCFFLLILFSALIHSMNLINSIECCSGG